MNWHETETTCKVKKGKVFPFSHVCAISRAQKQEGVFGKKRGFGRQGKRFLVLLLAFCMIFSYSYVAKALPAFSSTVGSLFTKESTAKSTATPSSESTAENPVVSPVVSEKADDDAASLTPVEEGAAPATLSSAEPISETVDDVEYTLKETTLTLANKTSNPNVEKELPDAGPWGDWIPVEGIREQIPNIKKIIIQGNLATSSGSAQGMFSAKSSEGWCSLESIECDSTVSGSSFDLSSKVRAFGGVNCTNMFSGCTTLQSLPDTFSANTSQVATGMFYNCSSLRQLPSRFSLGSNAAVADGRGVGCESMFFGCKVLQQLPDSFVGTYVSCANAMFQGCLSLQNLPAHFAVGSAAGAGIGKLIQANFMFNECATLQRLPNSFDAKNIYCAQGMFANCVSLQSLGDSFALRSASSTTPLNEDTSACFENCVMLQGLPASFTGKGIYDCSRFFCGCLSLKELPSTFSPETLISTSQMFMGCANLEKIPAHLKIDNNTRDMSFMFADCTKISDISPCKNWDVRDVTSNEILPDPAPDSTLGFLGLFAGCKNIVDVSPLANWQIDSSNMEQLRSMEGMRPVAVTGLTGMFGSVPKAALQRLVKLGFMSEGFAQHDLEAPPIMRMSFGSGWSNITGSALNTINVWQPVENDLTAKPLTWLSIDVPSKGHYRTTNALFSNFDTWGKQGTWVTSTQPVPPDPGPDPTPSPTPDAGGDTDAASSSENKGNLPSTGDFCSTSISEVTVSALSLGVASLVLAFLVGGSFGFSARKKRYKTPSA